MVQTHYVSCMYWVAIRPCSRVVTLIRIPNYRKSNYPRVTTVRCAQGIVAQFHAGSLIELAYPSIHPGGTCAAFQHSSQLSSAPFRLGCLRTPTAISVIPRENVTTHLLDSKYRCWLETRGDTNFARLIPKMSLTAIITFSRAITNELYVRNTRDICI